VTNRAEALPTPGAQALPRDAPQHTFPALDGMRAVAATMVVATHAAFATGRYVEGTGGGLLARLDFGVALFFLLSGFLLFRPWALALATGERSPRTGAYLWRRALRILPAYWLATLAALLLLPANQHLTAETWLRNLSLTQIYGFGLLADGLTQTWSLCTEVLFYLLLPVLALLLCRALAHGRWHPTRLLLGCSVLAVAAACWSAYVCTWHGPVTVTAGLWLPGFLGWFGGGMALAVVQVHVTTHPGRWPFVHSLGSEGVALSVAAAGLFVIAATPVAGPRTLVPPSPAAAVTKSLLYLLCGLLLLWPAVFGQGRGPVYAVLSCSPMRWLGKISYGVFLFHLMLLEAVARALGYRLFTGSLTVLFVLTMVATIAVAALSYRVVEEPAQRLRGLVPRGVVSARLPALLSPRSVVRRARGQTDTAG
jgi:peptidoglycan/LPS O-acetylase OafA/YrhL